MSLSLRQGIPLSEKGWKVIELLDRMLLDFGEALRMLEGDAQSPLRKGGRIEASGNMWDIASTYEFLMDNQGEGKAAAGNYPDQERFKVNINLGWAKLNESYTKLDETPACYTSDILNPVSRWGNFEDTWTDEALLLWLEATKTMARTLWDEGCRYSFGFGWGTSV